MRLVHAVLPGVHEHDAGTNINIDSAFAVMPRSTYGACKDELVMFSRLTNGRYGFRSIAVTAVCPGCTHTQPHARLGFPRSEQCGVRVQPSIPSDLDDRRSTRRLDSWRGPPHEGGDRHSSSPIRNGKGRGRRVAAHGARDRTDPS